YKMIEKTTDDLRKYKLLITMSRLYSVLKKYARANDSYLSAIKYLESEIAIESNNKNQIEVIRTPLEKISNQVLIVGSAPTIERHKCDIVAFEGEIWALNDAWF
ncbi:MAG TPA: hypothetical protein PLD30_04860, partial [Candidatus Competibacteraceae bacterium]|nr:hypothetical protein [Candidatus Competibacteraceae bacterium]